MPTEPNEPPDLGSAGWSPGGPLVLPSPEQSRLPKLSLSSCSRLPGTGRDPPTSVGARAASRFGPGKASRLIRD